MKMNGIICWQVVRILSVIKNQGSLTEGISTVAHRIKKGCFVKKGKTQYQYERQLI
jgi:hypothetical protein